ncbi:TPA: hypothetical protein SVM56_001981, partial [Streptococcus equi subsp. equi]|nr:hypothetical protein [Streptococcus equi subsp. equi]HEL1483247.1 hypothetical protein [Streptococcus equi subsp. equi]
MSVQVALKKALKPTWKRKLRQSWSIQRSTHLFSWYMVKHMDLTSFRYVETNDYVLPEYGFKIHISGTFQNYKAIFSVVFPYLKCHHISFKYLKDEKMILENVSDMEDPSESGKFITIYPRDREHCKQLLSDLYELIPVETEGVYILSDRNYKDSNVIFYRYGLIEPREKVFVNAVPILIGPNGEQWQDFQKCYFDLPHWIEDLQEKQILLSSYLSENYQVESLLKQSNGGNIYKAIHLDTGKNVVIKECRSHIICTASISKKQLRDNEWNLSGLITNNIPKSIEKVHEWINDYYIYE